MGDNSVVIVDYEPLPPDKMYVEAKRESLCGGRERLEIMKKSTRAK